MNIVLSVFWEKRWDSLLPVYRASATYTREMADVSTTCISHLRSGTDVQLERRPVRGIHNVCPSQPVHLVLLFLHPGSTEGW